MPKPPPAAETRISTDLVQALVNEFAPHLSNEPIEFFAAGWDNEIHRVGAEHVLRLPRRQMSADLVVNEQTWLPELAPTLPLTVPVPEYVGKPSLGYPYPWSLLRWIPGVPLAHSPALAQDLLVQDLSGFINALNVPAPEDAPENAYRGIPLTDRDEKLRESALECGNLIDHDTVIELWDELVATPSWGGEPVWLHGDLHPLNLLVRGGRLTAVIDWGDITAGDPALNLSVAWMLFDEEGRSELRKEVRINDHAVGIHTWNRARGWALSLALSLLAHSEGAPTMRRMAQATLAQVLR